MDRTNGKDDHMATVDTWSDPARIFIWNKWEDFKEILFFRKNLVISTTKNCFGNVVIFARNAGGYVEIVGFLRFA